MFQSEKFFLIVDGKQFLFQSISNIHCMVTMQAFIIVFIIETDSQCLNVVNKEPAIISTLTLMLQVKMAHSRILLQIHLLSLKFASWYCVLSSSSIETIVFSLPFKAVVIDK